jgi:hypothetical protein
MSLATNHKYDHSFVDCTARIFREGKAAIWAMARSMKCHHITTEWQQVLTVTRPT